MDLEQIQQNDCTAQPTMPTPEYTVDDSGIVTIKARANEINPEFREALSQRFFDDYGFSIHIPPSTLTALNITIGPDTDIAAIIQQIGASEQVTKLINICGWGATREIWEIAEAGESWTMAQIRTAEAKGKNVVVINVDPNGWGESPITPEGLAILLKSTYFSDPKTHLPGSVEYASEALIIFLNEILKAKGLCVFYAHSQGEKIINRLLHKEESQSDRRYEAIGLAGAETGYNLTGGVMAELERINTQIFPKLRELFGASLPDAPAVKTIMSNAIKGITHAVALEGLDRKLIKVIEQIHAGSGAKYNPEDLFRLLYIQAQEWTFESKNPPYPGFIQRARGEQDQLTPNEAYEKWLKTAEADDPYITKTLKYYPGPHYFFLKPENQAKIIEATLTTAFNRETVRQGAARAFEKFDNLSA